MGQQTGSKLEKEFNKAVYDNKTAYEKAETLLC